VFRLSDTDKRITYHASRITPRFNEVTSLLKFVSTYLALSYLAFAALVSAGVLQVLAAWRALAGLALFDYRRRPAWRHACGPLLIALGYVWFFATRRELITPGPAGAELTILFGGGVALALAVTLPAAAILRPYRPQATSTGPEAMQAHPARLAPGEATLLQDAAQSQPGPAICLLPDPAAPREPLLDLADRLARRGWLVLVPAWGEALQRYPDALALVPAAMAFLSRHPLADANRLAVAGVGLGADLALRAAAEDRSIRAVVALAPLWEPANARPSLGLLAEMTYPEALRWGLRGRRGRLLDGLASTQALPRIAPRPALVLYGGDDAVVPLSEVRTRLQTAELRTMPGVGHLSLAASPEAAANVAQWLDDNL